MSEGTANRRVAAARLVRRMPALTEHLRKGTLTLSALMIIRNVITEANVEDIVAQVAGKKTKHVEEVVARIAPKPDVPAALVLLEAPPESVGDVEPSAAHMPAAHEKRARLAPLAEARWGLQLTADQALHDKIERAADLMRHRNPSGDLTVLVGAAFDALLEKLEAPRKERPKRRRTVKAGRVAAATRAAVFARDGQQCTYVSADGHRCASTTLLQLDHILSRALGGSGEADNLRVRCRAHNKLHAEEDFGREHIEARIQERKRTRSRPATGGSGGPKTAVAAANPSAMTRPKPLRKARAEPDATAQRENGRPPRRRRTTSTA